MMHITCDCCGKTLRSGHDAHYIVKIEAYAAHDPHELTDEDLDDDQLEQLSKVLEEMEDNPGVAQLAEPYKHFRFDLCADCQKQYVRDPLHREAAHKLFFSNN